MKNFIVRLSVLALAATGFASSTVVSKSASKKVTPVVIAGSPTPMCTPGHGVCGMD